MTSPGEERDRNDPEERRRLAAVLDAALEVPAAELPAFLDGACSGDARLRERAEALLAAEERLGNFLEGSTLDLVPEALASTLTGSEVATEEHPLAAGKRIGVWRIEREIGRGGGGTVYLAARAVGGFDQQVAIKLVRERLHDVESVRLFLRERRILARLDHPHIARLVDGGMCEDGRPYLAMEHVRGEPITAYCERLSVDLHAALGLFEQAGRAVEFAHQNLVVHRDLKPSNILVNEQGQVKLLDFGIAKLLGPENIASVSSQPRLTLEYAAPEHLLGEPVTTATDVYSLGVVLYELLTGQWPYRLQESSPRAISRAVLHEEPVTPSLVLARADADARRRGWYRRVRGDLDRIVLKAIRKQPAERYPSVHELLDDLGRFRSGQPVSVTPSTPMYRARCFLSRNKMAVLASAAVVLVLLASAITATWLLAR